VPFCAVTAEEFGEILASPEGNAVEFKEAKASRNPASDDWTDHEASRKAELLRDSRNINPAADGCSWCPVRLVPVLSQRLSSRCDIPPPGNRLLK
jgi:hypothetical protein